MKRPGRNEIYELQVNGNLSANNARAIRKAVIGGHGIAMVPRCMVYEDLQDGKLTEILAGHCGKVLGIYAVYPYTRNLPLKTPSADRTYHRFLPKYQPLFLSSLL